MSNPTRNGTSLMNGSARTKDSGETQKADESDETDPGEMANFHAFDRAVDALFDRLRGRPRIDAAAAVVSNLGDYGFIWSLVASAKGRRKGPERRRAMQSLGAAGVTSYTLNAAVKQLVQRERPEPEPGRPVLVRSPTSSSFPSGHTLAAFCTATVLADSEAERVVYLGFASAVAASRVHLRAHHPSDVVGGALLGVLAGKALRHILR